MKIPGRIRLYPACPRRIAHDAFEHQLADWYIAHQDPKDGDRVRRLCAAIAKRCPERKATLQWAHKANHAPCLATTLRDAVAQLEEIQDTDCQVDRDQLEAYRSVLTKADHA